LKLCRQARGRQQRETQAAQGVQTDRGDDVGIVAVSAQIGQDEIGADQFADRFVDAVVRAVAAQ
jgi:hypothetical protein